MQIEVNGKSLETEKLVSLLTEGESHADKITIKLPTSYDTLDLTTLTYIIAGVSEKDTRVEQTLIKSAAAGAILLTWDIDESWAAVSGKLSLELLGQNSAGAIKIKFVGTHPILVRPALQAGTLPAPDVMQKYLSEVRTDTIQVSQDTATSIAARDASASSATAAAKDATAAAGSAATAARDATSAKADADKAHAIAGFDGTFGTLTGKPATYPPTEHNHDGRYFTEAEVSEKLSKKAPAGYGLGAAPETVADANDAIQNGWYSTDNATKNLPALGKHATLFVITSNRPDILITQYYYPVTQGFWRFVAKRIRYEGVWQPWEWVNPPMGAGDEYRTTERYMDKPVYVKFMDFGALPNNTQAYIAHGVASVERVVDQGGSAVGVAIGSWSLPYFSYDASRVTISANPNSILVYANFDASANTATVFFKYTKTTD